MLCYQGPAALANATSFRLGLVGYFQLLEQGLHQHRCLVLRLADQRLNLALGSFCRLS